MAVALSVDFIYVALTRSGGETDAVSAVGALVLATVVSLFTLPALGNRAWHAAQPEGEERSSMIGGTWWSVARLLLSVAVLSSILFALLGYATLAAQLHDAIYFTCLLIAIALLLHRLIGDLLEEAAAPDTPSGRWVRHRLGLPADATLRGQHLVMLLVDLVLLALLAVLIPAAWGVDTDAILNGAGQLIRGVQIGGVTISLGNIGMAIVAFVVCILLARLIRRIVRDRVLPTVDAPMPLRQSIDAGLNYVGVIVAILIGIGALGIDFTNLAIVLGALSVGIGLGLQNIANNVISGVFLLVERPIKAGDWVAVSGHEGFVRRINIRATEVETFQRTHVLVPNSMFLQNPVVNRTYSDTSSRVEIKLTVGLGTDVAVMEGLLREAALGHPRVLRVPAPIVRFIQITTSGLDFELFVFVARLEDRLVVSNDLNKAILAKLIELKIVDPCAGAAVAPARRRERRAGGTSAEDRPMPPRRRRDEAPRRRPASLAGHRAVRAGRTGGRGAVGLFAQPAGRDADRALRQRPLEVHRRRRRARPCARAGRSRRHPRRADPWLDGLAAHVGGLGARAFKQGATDLGRSAGAWAHRRVAARRVHDRGLCRFHRGAGRHAQSRPLRAGRPFDWRRGGLDLCRNTPRSRQPAHPGRRFGLSAHRRRRAAADAAGAHARHRRHRHLLQARALRAGAHSPRVTPIRRW